MTLPADKFARDNKEFPAAMANDFPGEDAPTLIDQLLAEQRQLTAVETFSRAHDAHAIRSRLYRDLLPASPPAPGQQYAFEVDLDKCFGCKACVGACHSLNGLDDDETWRSVGLLTGNNHARSQPSFQQHVTTACHHCVDPGCLNGCPVLAYDKDPLTGIVRHLDDQCIGCQYCVMKCPYEVPQYSKARGIVRKCDMCHSRLAVGEAPACVQACPSSAIRITVVEQAKVRGKYRQLSTFNFQPPTSVTATNAFLPASPNPAITLPTTRFVTARTLPENLLGGDHSTIRRSDSHLPLVILLVLSQLAVGTTTAALLVNSPQAPLLIVALMAGLVALVAGSLHLGQPLKAWRSFLGWHKSWFSREVIAMSGFVFLLALAVAAVWPLRILEAGKLLSFAATLAGLITVACSAMIYVDTRRDFWSAAQSFPKFFGTTLVLGAGASLAVLAFSGATKAALLGSSLALVVGTIIKLAFERRIFLQLVDEETPVQTPINKTARLLADELNGFVRARIACGLFGGVLLPSFALVHEAANIAIMSLIALALCVAGELIERYLFFTAVATQKMPGGFSA